MLANILLVLHLLVAVAIVILVLLQQGKGSDMGAAFGGGSSQSLFGARGSANFLSRATSLLVAFFFLSSMTLAYLYTHQSGATSVFGNTSSSSVTDSSADSDADSDSPLSEADTPPVTEQPTDPSDVPSAPAESEATK